MKNARNVLLAGVVCSLGMLALTPCQAAIIVRTSVDTDQATYFASPTSLGLGFGPILNTATTTMPTPWINTSAWRRLAGGAKTM